MAPKKGNKNAVKNGSRIDRKGLTVGELPTKMIACKREAREYRRQLEKAVLDAKGQISHEDNHLIDAATGCTMSAGICRWILRNRFDEMTIADIRATNKEIRDAKRERAKIVKELKLSEITDPWQEIDNISISNPKEQK